MSNMNLVQGNRHKIDTKVQPFMMDTLLTTNWWDRKLTSNSNHLWWTRFWLEIDVKHESNTNQQALNWHQIWVIHDIHALHWKLTSNMGLIQRNRRQNGTKFQSLVIDIFLTYNWYEKDVIINSAEFWNDWQKFDHKLIPKWSQFIFNSPIWLHFDI